MATISPQRPSRRAAARRNIIVDDSDGEGANVTPQEQDSGEEFTPAPKRSPRKSTRRKTTADVPSTPRTGRGRRPKTSEAIEPSQIFEPDESTIPHEPVSPTKKASPRKRKSNAAPTRKSRLSVAPDNTTSLPTPAPSTSPEPVDSQTKTALGDITDVALNEKTPATDLQNAILKPESTTTVLEKPMDIVVKSRSLAVPTVEEPTGPRPRMVITHLMLNNFKSYAGKQMVGPFHVSFSSVVGPNGSGKSNVIDSLLFVFGFRASKMRQGKISALIHNSANFPDLPYCEVEVHFQQVIDLPNGSHEVIPDSQLVVSRRAFKNNSSKYYMNARETNFTAVTTFLKERGIDLDHKRFLILQGEVESIAQMKPKAANEHDDGLLEYLEDIIGTSKYKTPIEEAAGEVETLNEVCVEKNTRVQHVEKEKNNLEDKKNKALAYLKDENDLAEKQAALYQIYMKECDDNNKVTEEAIQQMADQLNAELEKHQGNEDGIKELEKSYKRGAKENESLEKSTQALVREMAKFDKETVKFEEKRKFLNGKQKKLEKTVQSSRHQASEASSLIESHSADMEKKTAEVAQLEKEMSVEEKELFSIRESLKGKTQGLSDQIAMKQKSLEPWNAKVNDKQSALAVAQSELDILREKANAGAKALEDIQAKMKGFEETRASKLVESEECQNQKAAIEKEVAHLGGQIRKFSDREPEIRAAVSGARQKADEARASLASTQNQGNVLTGLMRLKESGRIEGFHGRLGNLGTIDEKYDVAISTACPALENLVVDTVEVGQQCIDYLRKNNLGRANFILLDRLTRRDLSRIQTPEDVPRLFDLVQPKDPKFGSAFYSVMQNTLVANDLGQANRIAYGAKRWRVVTLDGQLIDVSGTMSGGGTKVARGGMSSKLIAETTKEQVQKYENDRDEMEKKFQQFLDKQRDLEATVKDKSDKIPRLETQIQKINLEIESCDRNLADAERRAKELQAEHKTSKNDDGQLKALEKQIVALEMEIEKLHTETSGVEQEIQSLQDKIMEVGGVQLRSQKAKVDGLKEHINLLNEEISNAEVGKSKNEKLKIKHEKTRCDGEKELEEVGKELEKLEDDVKSQAAGASSARRNAEEAQESLEIKKEELAALKKQLDEKTSELNGIRAAEIEMRNKLEENQKIQAENHKRSKHWQEKLAKLSLQNISDISGGGKSEEQQQEEEETLQLPKYTDDELSDMSKDALKAAIASLEEKTQKAAVDLSVLPEYRRRCAEHASRSADLAEAIAARTAAKSRLDTLRSLRLIGFMEGFSTISLRLKEMYQMITMGGNAELELVDSLDPFSEGILFSVMPPKKSWKNIGNLSGGEKTLSSLALVFALHHYRPTPLYVMDEIDAALDFRNVSIVASYIKERTKNAQFIVISLRNNMFELASRLVGVYKVNHMTKSVTVENRDYIVGRPPGP